MSFTDDEILDLFEYLLKSEWWYVLVQLGIVGPSPDS